MPWDLVIAAAVALVAGTVNAIGQSKTDDEIYSELEKKRLQVEAQYKEDKEQAQLEYDKAKEEDEREAAQIEDQADLTDKSLNITETAVSNDINTAIDNLYLSQAENTLGWNNALMQAGSSEGASYASLAGSGVRAGSSLSDAVLMESTVNESQLQFSKDAQRRSDNNNLGSILNNLAGNQFNIYQNRVGADVQRDNATYLKNLYEEGGYNYNLYESQKREMASIYNYNLQQIRDEKNKHSNDTPDNNKTWNVIGAFFGGGYKGYTAGYNLADSTYKSLNYKRVKE